MKYIVYLGLFCLCACSFKSKDGSNRNQPDQSLSRRLAENNDTNLDSDGDLVSDKMETNLGTNPFVANFPKLRIRFLQNYLIKIDYKALADGKKGSYIIDTSIRQNDPSFQYRIGEVYLKSEALRKSASVAQFSNHTWGEINEHDLSWVKYPSIDHIFYLNHVLEASKLFDESAYEIENISIRLKNSVRLKEGSSFSKVKDLQVSFLYYDYDKESYEVIHTEKIRRDFNAGINETFDVLIESAPINVIKENFLKRGEFIISELKDYEIPDLRTTYKTLLTSVKNKSLPVLISTPAEIGQEYIATGADGKSFNEILDILYNNRFRIENDELLKIGQFVNNLPSFQYLSELGKEDKKGKWFIFTNKLDTDYLHHKFTTKDILSLSYALGNELSKQVDEKVFSFRKSIDSMNTNGSYPLGNIKSHSNIQFQVKGIRGWGEKRNYWKDRFHNDGGSCGHNCMSSPFNCDYEVSLLTPYDNRLSLLQDGKGLISKMKLIINDESFDFTKLINEKLVKLKLVDSNYHFAIPDISKIKELKDYEENLVSLKLIKDQNRTFIGAKLLSMEGAKAFICPALLVNMSGDKGWPVSVESYQFDQWQRNVHWDHIQRGVTRDFEQNFALSLSSSIFNYFN